MNYHDKRFRTCTSLLFHSFNIQQKRAVCINTSLRMQKQSTEAFANVTSDNVNEAMKALLSGKSMDNKVSSLVKKISSVGSKVRGSSYAKRSMRLEIQSLMVIMIFLIQFFLTSNNNISRIFHIAKPKIERRKCNSTLFLQIAIGSPAIFLTINPGKFLMKLHF